MLLKGRKIFPKKLTKLTKEKGNSHQAKENKSASIFPKKKSDYPISKR